MQRRDPVDPSTQPPGGTREAGREGEGRAYLARLRSFVEPLQLPEGSPPELRRLAEEYNASARAFLDLADAVAAAARGGARPPVDAPTVARSFEAVVTRRHRIETQLSGVDRALAAKDLAGRGSRGGS
ncbi:MAG TPA: hypothetical protein VF841_20645 [Anaeromyxobacter sp.]